MITYPKFENLDPQYLRERILKGIEDQKEEIDLIRQIPKEQANYQNVVLALEQSGELLDDYSSIFFNLLHTDGTDEMQDIASELVPILSELDNAIRYDDKLAELVKAVYENRNTDLNEVEKRLLERTYQSYADNGAYLEKDKKKRLEEIKKRLSELSLQFSKNLLKEQKRFEFHTEDLEQLSGLSKTHLSIASERAKQNQKEGWLLDLSFPSYVAVMSYADNRDLRQTFYMARQTLCNNEKETTYNGNIVKEIAKLRQEFAHLLGAKTYAEKVLRRKMAKTPQRVYEMLEQLKKAYKPKAIKEYESVSSFFRREGYLKDNEPLMLWDWAYAAEKYRKAELDFDMEHLRPYFELHAVSTAVFGLAERLYGISFQEDLDLPKYRDDVKGYRVLDNDGSCMGLLYTDFFPSPGKQSGAWMTNFVERHCSRSGKLQTPVVSIVMNFTPATSEQPSLLSFDEVNTFLHEFGHALHGLLSRQNIGSLSGTNVVRDFVELPSQFMENFLREKDYLSTFAYHYETKQPLPDELMDKLLASQNFLSGYQGLRQLNFGYLDMAWHSLDHEPDDVNDFEEKVCKDTNILPYINKTCVSTAFSHIFSGGYAAGYYGYKWAEVLDADAYELFKENGVFNVEIAKRFRENILEKGDLEEPEKLYEAFRGRAPRIEALLKREGL